METEAPAPAGPDDPPGPRLLVVVTRPHRRAGPMIAALAGRGLDVLHVPSVEITGPADPAPLERAARDVADYDWIAFTSASGVVALAAAGVRPRDVLPGAGPRLAAVGPSTARAVEEALGRAPDLVPGGRYSGAGLAEAFGDVSGIAGARVLLPLAEAAADLLPTRLEQMGARAERVTAYRSVPPPDTAVGEVRAAIVAGRVALLTFTSPSTAENFLDAVGTRALEVPAAAIGPTTAGRARELGYRVTVVAGEHTVEGLVLAVARALESDPPGPSRRG